MSSIFSKSDIGNKGSIKYLKSGEFLWPVPASKRISSKFGKRWGRRHEGIDIAFTGKFYNIAEGLYFECITT